VRAKRGSASFGNDWQWVIGIPVTAFLLVVLQPYLGRHATEYLGSTKPFAAFTVALAAFVITVLASIAIRLFIEPSELFYGEERRALSAEDELRKYREPKINLYLDLLQHGVTEFPTEINGVRSVSKWVQITVSPGTQTPLVDCEAWLTDVEKLDGVDAGAHFLEERAQIKWSQLGANKITIRPLLDQRANLFSMGPSNGESPNPTLEPLKFRLLDILKAPGRFRLKVVVAAENCPSEAASFIFVWQDYQRIFLTKE
jgi:hypothetical protein